MLLATAALGAGSCGLMQQRDVRRIAITYCDCEARFNWGLRRHLLSETAVCYKEYFPLSPKMPKMEYGPGTLLSYQIERIFVDWPRATVRVRARFKAPDDIAYLGERAPEPEDGWYTVNIYLRREHDLWKVDELATKKQWIETVIGNDYGAAWIAAVKQQGG